MIEVALLNFSQPVGYAIPILITLMFISIIIDKYYGR